MAKATAIDKYLVDLARKLNKECLQNKHPRYIDWEPADLDYDLDKCRKYCYSEEDDYYSGQWNKLLCKSCASTLEEYIRKPYNKTIKERGEMDKIILAMQKKIDALEEQIKILQEKVNW
jgi:hypothetical protein